MLDMLLAPLQPIYSAEAVLPVQHRCSAMMQYLLRLSHYTSSKAVAALTSYICAAGSAPAIGHTPPGAHQQIIGSMSIPLFPGMPGVAMHMGPGPPGPNINGPAAAAPAANGPAGPSPARPGPTTAGGRGAGSGAAPPAGAGAGQGAGRGQGMGLNQALSIALQSAMAQAGGQAGRPSPGDTVLPFLISLQAFLGTCLRICSQRRFASHAVCHILV